MEVERVDCRSSGGCDAGFERSSKHVSKIGGQQVGGEGAIGSRRGGQEAGCVNGDQAL